MDRRTQLARAPRDHDPPHPVHPIGPARRRWPTAYDGGYPPEAVVQRRYRRAFDGDEPVERRYIPARRRNHTRPRTALESLRQGPVRNGLIGLAVAGTAAPIAVNHYQQALRTDPSHESTMGGQQGGSNVNEMWQQLDQAEASAAEQREATIAASISKYADFGLDRALAEAIYDAALENEIDPEVAYGLVRAESSFKNTSTSPVGAVGLTQLMPKTAAWLQPGVTQSELRNPETNLRIGFKYLRQMIDKYEGDTRLALLAYNRGPGTVDRELRNGLDPDNGYADFVGGKENHGHSLYTKG